MKTMFSDFVYQLKMLCPTKKIRSFFTLIKQKIITKREQIIYYLIGITIALLILSSCRGFVCNFIELIFPVYASLLAIGLSVIANDTKWLVYWIIYTSFGFLDYFNSDSYVILRFYWLGKCMFLIWLMIPGPKGGTNLIYYQIIRRFIGHYSQTKQNYYNASADESYIENANSYDDHCNPTNREYDLGRDGAFTGYYILIGQFYTSGNMKESIQALEMKGFHVENVKDELEFLSKLQTSHYQIAWVISASAIINPSFISTLTDFHLAGGSIFLFADNIPYVSHASACLHKRFGITLQGNYRGNKTLIFNENGYLQAGHFGQHEIFTGIKNLFEGVTISHPVHSIPTSQEKMITIATATDGNPCIVVYDPPATSGEGRLCLDCGFTKLFINWDSAGTARFIVNASCWLARAENDIGFEGYNETKPCNESN